MFQPNKSLLRVIRPRNIAALKALATKINALDCTGSKRESYMIDESMIDERLPSSSSAPCLNPHSLALVLFA
jgi:hypothetical protein